MCAQTFKPLLLSRFNEGWRPRGEGWGMEGASETRCRLNKSKKNVHTHGRVLQKNSWHTARGFERRTSRPRQVRAAIGHARPLAIRLIERFRAARDRHVTYNPFWRAHEGLRSDLGEGTRATKPLRMSSDRPRGARGFLETGTGKCVHSRSRTDWATRSRGVLVDRDIGRFADEPL